MFFYYAFETELPYAPPPPPPPPPPFEGRPLEIPHLHSNMIDSHSFMLDIWFCKRVLCYDVNLWGGCPLVWTYIMFVSVGYVYHASLYMCQMFQSATYAVLLDQFYTKLLHLLSWSWSFYLQSFSQIAFGTKNFGVLKLSLNRICRIAQPFDKSKWIEPISHILFTTYPSDIFQAKSHRYGY